MATAQNRARYSKPARERENMKKDWKVAYFDPASLQNVLI